RGYRLDHGDRLEKSLSPVEQARQPEKPSQSRAEFTGQRGKRHRFGTPVEFQFGPTQLWKRSEQRLEGAPLITHPGDRDQSLVVPPFMPTRADPDSPVRWIARSQ